MGNRYSLALSKYAFLHKDYLKSYIHEMPAEIRTHVRDVLNCEDIAMTLWVSYKTHGTVPMLVDRWAHEKSIITLNAASFISDQAKHLNVRHHCVNDFANRLSPLKQWLRPSLLYWKMVQPDYLKCGLQPAVDPEEAWMVNGTTSSGMVSSHLRTVVQKRQEWKNLVMYRTDGVVKKHLYEMLENTTSVAVNNDPCFFRGNFDDRVNCGEAKGICFFEIQDHSCGYDHFQSKFRSSQASIPPKYHDTYMSSDVVEVFPKSDEYYSQCSAILQLQRHFPDRKKLMMARNRFRKQEALVKCEWLEFVDNDSEQSSARSRLLPYAVRNKRFQYDKPREHDITLVTQASVDELDFWLYHSENWSGPISCCVYIQRIADISAAFKYMQRFQHFNQTTFHFSFGHNLKADAPKPANSLRNCALNYTNTEYVLLLDVDTIPMPGLYEKLTSLVLNSTEVKKALDNRTLLLLPSFEYTSEENQEKLGVGKDWVPASKEILINHIRGNKANSIQSSHLRTSSEHLGDAHYSEWLTNASASAFSIPQSSVGVQNVAESDQSACSFAPFVLGKREGLPFYWPVAGEVGKTLWLREASLLVHRFAVLRNYFVFQARSRSGNDVDERLTLAQTEEFELYLDERTHRSNNGNEGEPEPQI